VAVISLALDDTETATVVLEKVVGNYFHALIVLYSGLLGGGLLAFWARPLASSVFRDLRPESVLAIAFAAVAVFVVGLLACLAPVRRAARVDPIVALRIE
jgi:ABC-type antimicrobial peptide transport system permease subunit